MSVTTEATFTVARINPTGPPSKEDKARLNEMLSLLIPSLRNISYSETRQSLPGATASVIIVTECTITLEAALTEIELAAIQQATGLLYIAFGPAKVRSLQTA